MLRRLNENAERPVVSVRMADAGFPSPFASGLEYSSPARGTWNIVHTGMLIPEAHEIFVCAAGCLRGVVLTAAEMNAMDRFSTVAVREHNLLDGDMEELVIDGVTDILNKLPKLPPAVLVYISCVHHFTGCDLGYIYGELRARFPNVDFTDCYMNPIMRKSGLTPDQLMRARLYDLLKPGQINEKAVAIIGNDLPTRLNSDLMQFLLARGFRVHEITACKTYEQYQRMAESAFYLSYYPAAAAGGEILSKRLGGRHIYLPFSFDYDEIEKTIFSLAEALGVAPPDFTGQRAECEQALADALAIIGDRPIAIDYTFCPRPLGLALLLLKAGFRVERIYLDSISGEERPAFDQLKADYPDLELYPTVHAAMRFHSPKAKTNFLAIGQKAAHFTNTDSFVNVVEGGGMFGYEAILDTLALMKDACLHEKDMRSLVQIKGLGCECCL